MKNIAILLCCFILLSSCNNPKAGKEAPKAQLFPYIEEPAMLGNQVRKNQYIVKHFWDRYFDLSRNYSHDTTLVGGVSKENFTKAYAMYVSYLETASLSNMRSAQDTLLYKAEQKELFEPESIIWETVLSLSDTYLFDPNSPYRNEEFYLPVIEKALASSIVDEDTKEHYRYLLPLCSLNRLGTPAADFTYTLKNGRTGSLYKVHSDYTLLFFSNPGCHNCKEIIDALSSSQEVSDLLKSGKLSVLNIYPDADLSEWYDYMSHYPDTWINGFDQDLVLNSHTIYYIRAIPSLYLLDKDKKVIFKDAPPEKIIQFLVYLRNS
ncbi:MAG: DUF5106 domain-containing protein [Bacteroidales bacterium]|nr:DUF5106 domain-containing protein [Bacteroidales bacterium]MDD4670687.1 DUF5106 domain-containing protein [Bacteroidales bacterium]